VWGYKGRDGRFPPLFVFLSSLPSRTGCDLIISRMIISPFLLFSSPPSMQVIDWSSWMNPAEMFLFFSEALGEILTLLSPMLGAPFRRAVEMCGPFLGDGEHEERRPFPFFLFFALFRMTGRRGNQIALFFSLPIERHSFQKRFRMVFPFLPFSPEELPSVPLPFFFPRITIRYEGVQYGLKASPSFLFFPQN